MLELVAVMIGGYFFVQFSGYMIHWLLHRPQLGPVHRAHSDHHEQQYSPEDYLSETYRDAAGIHRPIVYYTPPALLIVAFAFWFLSPLAAAVFTLELALVAWANDWLHVRLHIEGHWLERYRWFWRLRDLHWHHHVDETKNLGIFSWFTDRLLGTYEEPKRKPTYYLPKDIPSPGTLLGPESEAAPVSAPEAPALEHPAP